MHEVLGGLGKDICCVLRRAPVSLGWHGSCAPASASLSSLSGLQAVCVKEVAPPPPPPPLSLPTAGEHSRAIPMQTHFGLV